MRDPEPLSDERLREIQQIRDLQPISGEVRDALNDLLEEVVRSRTRLSRLESEMLADLSRAEAAAMLDDDLDDDASVPKRDGRGPGVPGAMHLEAFGQSIADAFGHCPYHVGSSATQKTGWRDVDVRLILDDDAFHSLFPGFRAANHIDAWWALFCAAMSELGRARTGLPIDFQVQSMTEANERYPGVRHPLFLIHAADEHRPTMLPPDEGDDEYPIGCPDCIHGLASHYVGTGKQGCAQCACSLSQQDIATILDDDT